MAKADQLCPEELATQRKELINFSAHPHELHALCLPIVYIEQ